jgi:3-hydroxybutyryl-CoA dehydrogenase
VHGDGADAVRTAAFLRQRGLPVTTGGVPRAQDVIVVPTWGETVAQAVASDGVDPERSVGIDPLSLHSERVVLAVTPATSPIHAAPLASSIAHGRGDAEYLPVSVVGDTHGSIAQRLLSSIIAVAASIAERSIATPEAIDDAVRLALGYPRGPLAWGDHIGAARVLQLQSNLLASTGDDRYRPTQWVTQRALLDLRLTDIGTQPRDVTDSWTNGSRDTDDT